MGKELASEDRAHFDSLCHEVIGAARLDLLVDGRLVLELKAIRELDDTHVGQTLGYLKAGNYQLALLINFNVARLRDGIKRLTST